MKITAQQVYTVEVKQGKKSIEGFNYKPCSFRSDCVDRWVEGDLDGTVEIHFSNGSSIVIVSTFEEFEKIMTECLADEGQGGFWKSQN